MLVQSLDKVIGQQSQWAAVLDKFRQIETAVDNRYGKFFRVIAVQKSLKGLEIDLTADHTRELNHCIVSSRRLLLYPAPCPHMHAHMIWGSINLDIAQIPWLLKGNYTTRGAVGIHGLGVAYY